MFTLNVMVRHLQQLCVIYIAENWNSSEQSNRELRSFDKDRCQFSKRDNSQSGREASASTSNSQQTVCADLFAEAGESEKEIVSQYDKNTCSLVLLYLHLVNRCRGPCD